MKRLTTLLALALASASFAADIAVLSNGGGKHANEFDPFCAELGLALDHYRDTADSMAEFYAKIDGYDLVLASPLFCYQKGKKLEFDAAPLRRWIENGGVFVVTDGSYSDVRAVIDAIDPKAAGLATDKCTSTPWAVRGYVANAEPIHPLRVFPNAVSNGDTWAHFAEPAPDSGWRTIVRCSEGKPVTLVRPCGKGLVALSVLRMVNWKEVENFYAYVKLRKAGLDLVDFALTPPKPGVGHLELKLAAGSGASGASVVYTVTSKETSEAQAFEAKVEGASAKMDFRISLRGPVVVELVLKSPGRPDVRLFRRELELPPLMRVGPNAYRGILSTARRARFVKFPLYFAPDAEDLRGGKVAFTVYNGFDAVIARAEHKLPKDKVEDEMWFPIDLGKTGVGAYCVVAELLAPVSAKSEAAFEIIPPRPAQTVIDEDGTFLVNGKPFFPLGIYHIAPQFYPRAAELGFNTVQFWAWHATADPYGVPRGMYAAAGNGLKCLFETNHGKDSTMVGQCRNFADHPAMLMWYVADEPSEGAEKHLLHVNALRHENDKHHPTFVASCRTDLFKYHAKFADVFAMDPYGDEEKFVRWCKKAQEEIAPHKPVIAVPWAEMEDTSLIPLQAWTAIVHGARGIIWYCWNQVGGGPKGVGIHDDPETQEVYKKLLADIHKMEPWLFAGFRRPFEMGAIHGMAFGDGRRYQRAGVILVNTSKEPADYDFELKELGNAKETVCDILNGDAKSPKPEGNRLKGTLKPGEVWVRVW